MAVEVSLPARASSCACVSIGPVPVSPDDFAVFILVMNGAEITSPPRLDDYATNAVTRQTERFTNFPAGPTRCPPIEDRVLDRRTHWTLPQFRFFLGCDGGGVSVTSGSESIVLAGIVGGGASPRHCFHARMHSSYVPSNSRRCSASPFFSVTISFGILDIPLPIRPSLARVLIRHIELQYLCP
jgi:hypothetical protein